MAKTIGENIVMRIFIGESDRYAHKPLYEVLVELFRKEGFAGATVTRAISGFGAHSVYHTQKLLDISSNLPLIVEVVETEDRINAIMPLLDEMMKDGGMIILESARVIRYSPSPK